MQRSVLTTGILGIADFRSPKPPLYGADRAVASAVAALHLIGDADAILLYPYGMTYLDGRFVGFRYRPDSTCRTNFRTLGTFGTQ